MKKLILGLSAAALLCGCASEKKYNRELDSFLDQPVGKVEAKFGKPSAAKIIDDSSRVITYTKVDQSYDLRNIIFTATLLFPVRKWFIPRLPAITTFIRLNRVSAIRSNMCARPRFWWKTASSAPGGGRATTALPTERTA